MTPRCLRESLRRRLALIGLALFLVSGVAACQPSPQAQVGTLGKGIEVDQEEFESRR